MLTYKSTLKPSENSGVQNLIDHIKVLTNNATLGYALMCVMDDNDLGRGPVMACEQVNLHPIDPNFMAIFIKGIHTHGLQNKVIQNALDVGVHEKDVDITSLKPMQAQAYTNHVHWFEDALTSKSILYNGNHMHNYSKAKMAHNHYLKAQD